MRVAITALKFLVYGLELAGYSDDQIGRMNQDVQVSNFSRFFGSYPYVIEKIWVDLQTTTTKAARLDEGYDDPIKFLMAHYFLKMYPRDREMPAIFHLCRHTIREWTWYYIYKMQALKDEKIVWPEEWKGAENELFFTVDGVHFWTREMPHPIEPFDAKYYSHKNKHAGLSYEIGLSLAER